jgi:DtxR family Mn-dependent transcriptional regulator
MINDLSKSEREALKAIYRHTKNGAEAHTGDLAETLGVTPGTVTATVKRLADRELVDHRPYHGVTFTDEGRRHAVAAIRRHRIVERFLADQLQYSWSEADRLAPTFEHALPDEVEERMYHVLGNPATCPHGFPIPDREQDTIPEMPTLYDLDAGDVAEIALPSSTDDEIVSFLDDLGVRPGVQVEVREKHPFDGPLVLVVDGQDRTLGERIARHIYVRPTHPSRRGHSGGAAGDADGAGGIHQPPGTVPDGDNGTTEKPAGGNGATRKHKEGTTR